MGSWFLTLFTTVFSVLPRTQCTQSGNTRGRRCERDSKAGKVRMYVRAGGGFEGMMRLSFHLRCDRFVTP
jgi:hypothetical protein